MLAIIVTILLIWALPALILLAMLSGSGYSALSLRFTTRIPPAILNAKQTYNYIYSLQTIL
jgi:hypothetical protein